VKAVCFERFGDPADVLQAAERPIPTPGPGQVRIRMLMSPVNPSDLSTVRGVYSKIPSLPAFPGYEGVGVVDAAGPGLLGRLLLGRRAAFLSAEGGAWSEYVVVPARQAAPVSKRLPVEQAAMFFVNPMTAYCLTREVLKVPAGEWLLQTAAGAAVGRMILRLARRYGFRTINVVRRRELADELRSLGAQEVIVADGRSDEDELTARVREVAKGGVRYALDCVSGALGSQIVRCLAPQGRLVVYGAMSQQPLVFSSRDLMTPGSRVEGFWLGNYLANQRLIAKLRIVRTVGRLVRDGVLVSDVGRTHPLDEVKQAVMEAQREGRRGKVLLQIARD
jgi:NADPH:quinone reductase-like Zn-dependent oxidoreductase